MEICSVKREAMSAEEALTVITEGSTLLKLQAAAESPLSDSKVAELIMYDKQFLLPFAVKSGLIRRSFSDEKLKLAINEAELNLPAIIQLTEVIYGREDSSSILFHPDESIVEEYLRSANFKGLKKTYLHEYLREVSSGIHEADRKGNFTTPDGRRIHIFAVLKVLKEANRGHNPLKLSHLEKDELAWLADNSVLDTLVKVRGAERSEVSAHIVSVLAGSDAAAKIISYWHEEVSKPTAYWLERGPNDTEKAISVFLSKILKIADMEAFTQVMNLLYLPGLKVSRARRWESSEFSIRDIAQFITYHSDLPNRKDMVLEFLRELPTPGPLGRYFIIAGDFNYEDDAEDLINAISFADRAGQENFWRAHLPDAIAETARELMMDGYPANQVKVADSLYSKILDTEHFLDGTTAMFCLGVFPPEELLSRHFKSIIWSGNHSSVSNGALILSTVLNDTEMGYSDALKTSIIVSLFQGNESVINLVRRDVGEDLWSRFVQLAGKNSGISDEFPVSYIEKILLLSSDQAEEELHVPES